MAASATDAASKGSSEPLALPTVPSGHATSSGLVELIPNRLYWLRCDTHTVPTAGQIFPNSSASEGIAASSTDAENLKSNPDTATEPNTETDASKEPNTETDASKENSGSSGSNEPKASLGEDLTAAVHAAVTSGSKFYRTPPPKLGNDEKSESQSVPSSPDTPSSFEPWPPVEEKFSKFSGEPRDARQILCNMTCFWTNFEQN